MDPAATAHVPMTVEWSSLRYSDVDDQAAALPGWQQQYEQLSPGPFTGGLVRATLGAQFQFFTETNGCRLSQSVRPPAGSCAFAVRADAGPEARLNQSPFGRDDLVCLGDGGDAQISLPSGGLIAAVVLPATELGSYRSASHDPDPMGAVPRVGVARTAMAPLLRGFVDQVLSVARESPAALTRPQALRALCSATVSNLLFAMSSDGPGPLAHEGTARRRWQLVQQARAHIDEHLGEVFSVADVCRALGVSRRTLQYCFEDVLQINPIAYIRAVRLNAVRRDLKQADPGQDTVSDIAARWGFWHLGHFAADYRRMFGETPSATLQGRRGAGRPGEPV